MAAVSSKFDGFTIHKFTTGKVIEFTANHEVHMKWLEEVLIEAKSTFASTEIELLPKTPAVKRSRQKRKAAERSSAEDTSSETEKENKGGRAKRNKKNSVKRGSVETEPLKVIQTEPDSTTAPTEEETKAASVETAQPTVQVTTEPLEDVKPKTTKGKQAPPRASKRVTRRTTRSMSTARKGSVALSNDQSCTSTDLDDSAASDSSQNSRPKRGRKAKKAKNEAVLDSEGDAAVESTSNTGRPSRCSRSSKATATNKYVDHVKRLINTHEKMISDHSCSEDEFQSPKRMKMDSANSKEQAQNSSVLVPETPEKEDVSTNTPVKKFFPPVANIEKEEAEDTSSSKEEEEEAVHERENEASSPEKVTEDDKTDTDDDDEACAAVVEPITEKEPSPEKVAPLAEVEDLESSQEETVAEKDVAEEDMPEEEEETQQNEADDEDEEEECENIEQDSLEDVSVASSRSTRSRTSVQASVRRSNRPSVLASKSKKTSMVGRRSSIMRTVTISKRLSRASMQMASAPPAMDNLDGLSENEEEGQPLTPGVESFKKPMVDPTTHVKRMTRSRINRSLSCEGSESTEKFEDSLEQDRPSTRASSRLRSTKRSTSSSSYSNSITPPHNRSPSPECPPEKVIKPHPKSFLNALVKKNKTNTPTSIRGGSGLITSFIKRNTPQKKTLKEKQQEMKVQIEKKRKREEEIRKKVEDEKKNKIEEQKRKREERIRKVAEARQLRNQQSQQNKRQAMEARFEKTKVMSAQKCEQKRKEELQKRRQMTKKKAELEERKRQEEGSRIRKHREQEEDARRQEELLHRKKEFEDNERQRRMEEARRQQEERKLEINRQREMDAKKKRDMELAWEREQQQLKEEREREKQEIERRRFREAEDRERAIRARDEAEEDRKREAEIERRRDAEMAQREKDRQQLEQERLKANILKHNTSLMNGSMNTSSTMNTTITKEPAQSPQSYQITPQRTHKPSTDEDYGIDDLCSDDSSDDEDAPRKKVPSWAKGGELKAALINQYYKPPTNLDTIFPPITDAPDLMLIFKKKKDRFMKRTSSAHWNSPIWKPGMF